MSFELKGYYALDENITPFKQLNIDDVNKLQARLQKTIEKRLAEDRPVIIIKTVIIAVD